MSTMEKTIDEVVNGKKKVSWQELQREAVRQRLTGEMVIDFPEREPSPEPSGLPSAEEFWARKAWETQHRKELREYAKIKSPVEKQRYLQQFEAKEQRIFEQKQVEAKLEWRQQTRQQYPVGEYLILWRGEKAEIYGDYPKPSPITTRFTGGLKTGRLERGALDYWKILGAEPAKAAWRSPFKPISKRYVGLAEPDIPRNVEELSSQFFGWKKELRQQYPASEYQIKFLNGKAQISLLPEVAEARWRKELLTQYPTSKYRIEWKNGEALIYGLHVEPGIPQFYGGFPELQKRLEWEYEHRKPAIAPKEGFGLFLRREVEPHLLGLKEEPTVYERFPKLQARLEYERQRKQPIFRGEGLEQFVYAPIGVLSGFESSLGVSTPAVVSATFGAMLGQPEEMKRLSELGSGYAFGTLAGELLVGKYVYGKTLTQGVAWAKGTRIAQTIKFTRVAKTVTTLKNKFPTIKGSRVDVWLAQHSRWYYGKTSGIAVGEVSIPPSGRVSLGTLRASQVSAFMLDAPRTSGIWIGKSWFEPTKKSLKHLFFRKGVLSTGYLSELGFRKSAIEIVAEQRSVLPIVTQTQVTRMGIIPYVGGKQTFMGSSLLNQIAVSFAIGLTPKLRMQPKLEPLEWQPTLAREREKFRTITLERVKQKQKQLLIFPSLQRLQLKHQPLRQIFHPKLRKKEAVVPSLILPMRVITKQEPKPLVVPKLIQTPKYVYPPPRIVPPILTPPIIPPFRRPIGGADVSRAVAGLREMWFKRTHPIKTHGEMWNTFSFGPKKRRKKAKSKRKQKRRKKH